MPGVRRWGHGRVDHLFLNNIAFPVRRGSLCRGREELGDYCWEIEVYCDESPQLDYRNWTDDREEGPDDWLAGAGLLLCAQRLPLRVSSPDELIGRTYLFPPTLDDDAADWPTDLGWPFFFLYVWEGYATSQMRVVFLGKRDHQYRVEITGGYGGNYELRVAAWLDWQGRCA
jgi:hypothetical protein